jgi:hypothetical protein
MTDPEVPYRKLVAQGLLVLFVAAAADLLVELPRATASLQSWVCGSSGLCSGAYVVMWASSRFPYYVAGVGVVALILEAIRVGSRYLQSRLAPSVARGELFRAVVVVSALIAFAELVACAGDATCSLSKSCV